MAIWEFDDIPTEDLVKIQEHYDAIEELMGEDMMDEDMRRELQAEIERKKEEE